MMNRTLVVPCLIGFTASIASADQISLRLDEMGAYGIYSIAMDGRLDSGSSAEVNYIDNITTGERLWTNQYGDEVVTYCIQIYENVTFGEEYTFDMHQDLTEVPESPPYPGPMNEAQAGLVNDLYARFIDTTSGYLMDGTALTDQFDYETAASAFQLVVWEIINENIGDVTINDAASQLSLELGAFRADLANSNDTSEAASLIMSALGENRWLNTNGNVIGLTNPARQDQLMVVPLPMPGILAGIGLVGAAFLRRKLR